MAATVSTVNLGFTTERFPAGTHMCFLYNNETERREVIARFIEAGLTSGEIVGYFADVEELVEDFLAEKGIAIPDRARERQMRLSRAMDTYCPDGRFVIDRMLNTLKALHHDCVAGDFAGGRVSGEMGWALQPIPGREGLVEYEARVNLVLREHPLTAICQYDVTRFDGATIFDILCVHPAMIVHGAVVRNPYYITPEEFLSDQGAGE